MVQNKLQVLIASMNQDDYSLLDKMNIQTEAIVGNQCQRNSIEQLEYAGHHVVYLNFHERGVGLNRNNALMRANATYCLFADDDMTYLDDYESMVLTAFKDNPDADILIFNLIEQESFRYKIIKKHRVHFWNFMRYGTARIAIKLESVRQNGIYFNQCFGGGTEHCHGEDTLFLHDCLRKGLTVVAVPQEIAFLNNDRESTWQRAYDEVYLADQGMLYKTMNRRIWPLLCIQDAFRHRKKYQHPFFKSLSIMISSCKVKS